MSQLSFDHVFLHKNAHDTEVEAAKRVRGNSAETRQRVYEYIAAQANGATDVQIGEALGMSATRSNRPRRKELVDAGLVKDSGRRKDGHIIWEILSPLESKET